MRDVPWDQALDVILQAKGLGMERRGNLIRVAPQDVLEKERELAIARQKQQVELAPLETRLVPVSYATADGAAAARQGAAVASAASVSVDERTNVLIVRDIVDNLDDVEELVRTLDTPDAAGAGRGAHRGSDEQLRARRRHPVGRRRRRSTQAFGNQTGLVFPSNIGIAGGAYDWPTRRPQGLSPLAPSTADPELRRQLPGAGRYRRGWRDRPHASAASTATSTSTCA